MRHYTNLENYIEYQCIGSDRKHVRLLADEHQLFHSSLTVHRLIRQWYGYQLSGHYQSYSLLIHSEQGCWLEQLCALTLTHPYVIYYCYYLNDS